MRARRPAASRHVIGRAAARGNLASPTTGDCFDVTSSNDNTFGIGPVRMNGYFAWNFCLDKPNSADMFSLANQVLHNESLSIKMLAKKDPPQTKPEYSSLVPAVEQASRILMALAQNRSSKMTLTEICGVVGIHKSKGYSILKHIAAIRICPAVFR